MTRYLALDHGTKRIGVAVSDELKMIAQPLEYIPTEPHAAFLIRLKQIMAVQSEPFSEIELVSRVIPATATATAGAGEPTLAPPTA